VFINCPCCHAKLLFAPAQIEDFHRSPSQVTIEKILDLVSEYFKQHVYQITGKSRKSPVVMARYAVIWLTRKYTSLNYSEIGIHLNRDHTTILYAFRQVGVLIEIKDEISDHLNYLSVKLEADLAAPAAEDRLKPYPQPGP
jgi:chromosomal replication initiation ATPase DnaA